MNPADPRYRNVSARSAGTCTVVHKHAVRANRARQFPVASRRQTKTFRAPRTHVSRTCTRIRVRLVRRTVYMFVQPCAGRESRDSHMATATTTATHTYTRVIYERSARNLVGHFVTRRQRVYEYARPCIHIYFQTSLYMMDRPVFGGLCQPLDCCGVAYTPRGHFFFLRFLWKFHRIPYTHARTHVCDAAQ